MSQNICVLVIFLASFLGGRMESIKTALGDDGDEAFLPSEEVEIFADGGDTEKHS